MGIKKVGDRVRIFVAVKQLRNKAMSSRKKKNRVSNSRNLYFVDAQPTTLQNSLVALDPSAYTPPSSESPRQLNSRQQQATSINRRWSRQVEHPQLHHYSSNATLSGKTSSRPASPPVDGRNLRSHRYNPNSPLENSRGEQGSAYFNHPSSAGSSRRPGTPGDTPPATRAMSHLRQNPSIDGLTMASLPPNAPVIRVIYTGGQTKVLNIKTCKTSDEIILSVLRKLQLPETHYKSYCFYVLEGSEPNPANCRRLSDMELMRICDGSSRSERSRLILRKIHAGEPDMDEVHRAAQLAQDENQVAHMNALSSSNSRNQMKIQKLTGEPWENIQSPRRAKNLMSTAEDLERPDPNKSNDQSTKLRSFFGARPPSEMIIHELTSYFPSHQREDIEKTMRLSVRRSRRMSRAASRLSVVSNASFASSLKDAPPIPSIADTWLHGGGQSNRTSRPLSVSKFNLPQAAFRDSVASTSLQPLEEETLVEPNRKSYVSFDSGSEQASGDNDLQQQSYFDAGLSLTPDGSGSLNERLSLIVAEDGEEDDDDLNAFLAGDNFAQKNWMKGSLIGEGSFGSVYLALHSVTGELMAVKQVDLPSATKGTEFDKKKENMITALKHEIDLLQGLQHPNIVQYLGTSTDDHNLNIFLEYVPGGSIAMMLKQYNTFQEPLIKNFVRQILAGLSYLHSRDIIHRDIKGANVLVDNKGGIKISDFGISKRVEASTMLGTGATAGGQGHLHRPSLQGSVYWMAPEVVRQTAHTKKADIWSLGCLVVEMFIGAHPFPDCSQLQAIFAIGSNQARPPPPEHASPDAKAFLDMTFEINHEKRPSADELLNCKFLAPMT